MQGFRLSSFNSQRDGILPAFRQGLQLLVFVSIPNGMEFYRVRRKKARDVQVVSIPNGMEFYRFSFIGTEYFFTFQFPTGWNSTLIKAEYKIKTVFQFPTGWNSTKKPWNLVECNPVSIPNGMEFYSL